MVLLKWDSSMWLTFIIGVTSILIIESPYNLSLITESLIVYIS